MKILPRLLLPTLLLGAPVALAEAAPAAPAAATAPARTIDVSFRGSLRDALKTIAEKGGLNLVVTGDLDTPAEVRLRGITAEQALRTVARAYSLHLEQDGSIFTLRPLTAKEKESGTSPTASIPAPPVAPPVAAATPPAPPAPPAPPELDEDATPEDIAQAREDAREEARRARDEAKQAAKAEAEAAKQRIRDEIKSFRDSFKHRKGKRGARDVVARGQSLEVKEGESVESAVVYGGNLVVKGMVEGDAVVFGGNLEIQGHVEGDAHAFGGNVILGPNAQVEGDVSAFGGQVQKADGAVVEGSLESFGGAGLGRMVAGEIKRGMRDTQDYDASADHDDDDDHDDHGGGLASFILQFALLFGLGFLGQMFFPARMKELGDEIRANPSRNFLVGVVGMVALFLLSIVLSITLIGIPVAFALLVASMLGTALSYAAIASEVGTRLPVMRGRKTQAVVLALGLGLILLVSHIPVLGVFLNLVLIPLAFGAVIRTRFGYRGRGMPEPIFPRTENPV
ncbi:polymer-forming cytoskeletal protein [Corallococcus sp. EGB]|uniref:bactofilin family protein n=1 Tax=Corallococcus sp. EGB TaxID=1521117 RepID=UPI001CBF4E1D|nr:polymer-forming cytoskeletal protein [Corallococcus sp. EGB]